MMHYVSADCCIYLSQPSAAQLNLQIYRLPPGSVPLLSWSLLLSKKPVRQQNRIEILLNQSSRGAH